MTFDEILKLDDRLLALYEEATAYRKVGRRICHYGVGPQVIAGVTLPSPAERAAALPDDPEYCAYQEWDGTVYTPARGEISIKRLLDRVISSNEALAPYRDFLILKFEEDMPRCQHAKGDHKCDKPIAPAGPNSIDRGQFKVENGSVVIDTTPPFRGLLDGLRHAAGEAFVETPIAGMSQDIATGKWTWKMPKDEGDPVYIVKGLREAHRLADELEYVERYRRGEISKRYLKESIVVCGGEQREFILSADVTKENITGYLSYKPVVLTFIDPELEDKFARVCKAVATVLPIEKKLTYEFRQKLAKYPETMLGMPQDVFEIIDSKDRWFPTLAAFRAPFKPVAGILSASVPDMPAEVLDGWLGDVCRERMADFPLAYAWPALLAAASVLVPKMENPKTRTNLYLALIGPPGSGKSSAFDYAFYLLGLIEPILQRLKSGSAEGLAQHIGNVEGAPRLFYPDELAHLLKKAAIEGSTFPQVLNTMYYHDSNESTIAHGKLVKMNCRLSLAGGIPAEDFGDLFGTGTIGGFYDRFIFTECPTGFSYSYRPFEGTPVIAAENFSEDAMALPMPGKPCRVTIDNSVWAECDRWRKEFGLNRVVEHAIRAAVICASFDGRGVLRATDLGPALAFALYLSRVRKAFEPNPGKNTDGILTWKVQRYLEANAPDGEWMNKRVMLHNIRAWDFGATTIERVLHGMVAAGSIQIAKHGRQVVIRLNIERLD